MNIKRYKAIQFFLGLFTLSTLLLSLYYQYVVGLHPCPLCLMQRLCVFLLFGLMLFSLFGKNKANCIALFQLIVAATGLFFSLRQLWLQSLPLGKAPTCVPGFDALLRYFPWQTVVKTLLWGSADCSEPGAILYGFSMPAWAALYFMMISFCSFALLLKTRRL